MRAKHLRVFLVVIIIALLAVTPASAAKLARHGNVRIVDFDYRPQTATIHVGDVIRWLNVGAVTHTTDSDDLLWDADLDPGQSFVYRFTSAGTFNYHCDIHPFMKGSIVVVP
jgi:plastocyanin